MVSVDVRSLLIPILVLVPVFTVPVAIGVQAVGMPMAVRPIPMTVSVGGPTVPIPRVVSAVSIAVSVAGMVIATRVIAEREMNRTGWFYNGPGRSGLKTTATPEADLRCIAAGFSQHHGSGQYQNKQTGTPFHNISSMKVITPSPPLRSYERGTV
jgi:hypothetical protein